MSRRKLVFVYNADSGLLNSVLHLAHKTFAPESYPCSLCYWTYGGATMRKEWRTFVDGLDADVEFLHREEAAKEHGLENTTLPGMFEVGPEGLHLLLDAQALDAVESLDELMALVKTATPPFPSQP